MQKLATRAYGAANRLLLGTAHRVRFKGRHQLDSVEGKANTSGIRWCGDHVEWKGLVLPAILDPADSVQVHELAARVKYVRLVRRKLGQGQQNRYYAQLVCEGTPYRKPQHALGTGTVGLDLGRSTVAVVADQQALLHPFCSEVAPDAKALRRLERHLDRQRRAHNPDNYDARGCVKKGRRGAKHWTLSRRQRRVQTQRRELHRKLAATRKRRHGHLAHQVLALGDTFALEHVSYRAWQRRFGRSGNRRAPGLLVPRLTRLAERAGGHVVAINPKRAKRSQTCQCGRVVPKRLSQRWHACPRCGASAQRDLYSAHLVCSVHPATSLLDAGQAAAAWPGAEPLLQAAYEQAIRYNQPASGGQLLTSFGRPPGSLGSAAVGPSQSGSPAQGWLAKAKSRNAVARRQRHARVRQRRR